MFDRGDAIAFDHLAGVALDRLQAVNVAAIDKAHCAARASGAAGATDAVDIILRVGGQVVIEDDVDLIDVESARGDIGGDEQLDGTIAEAFQHTLAHLLGDVAMEAVGGIATVDEVLGALIDRALRVAEDDAEARGIHVEDAREHLDLGALADFEIRLLDGRDRAGFLLDLDDLWIFPKTLDQA